MSLKFTLMVINYTTDAIHCHITAGNYWVFCVEFTLHTFSAGPGFKHMQLGLTSYSKCPVGMSVNDCTFLCLP